MNMNNRCVITPTRKHITGCVAPRQALALNIWRQAVSKLTPLLLSSLGSGLTTRDSVDLPVFQRQVVMGSCEY